MTLSPKSFRLELDGASDRKVAVVTLDRPDRLNALTFEVYQELQDTFRAIPSDPRIRAVVLRGEGKGFCSGGDVRDIIGELFSRDMDGLLRFCRMTGALVEAIHTCPRPVVAELHGAVTGAGAVIAIASDIRIAAPSMKMAFLFPKVGLSGADMGAAWLLPRLVGLGHATDILLTGDFVAAAHAERIGLVSRIVPEESLHAEVMSVARKLADGPTFAHAMTKRMLESESTMDFRAALEAEAQAQAICMQHPDFREAHDAWREKRSPSYR